MKNVRKAILFVLLLALMISTSALPAFAAKSISPSDMQKSVVLIRTRIAFQSKNLHYANGDPITLSKTMFGTGFAIGIPGKPVQYIATCDHVIEEQSGIYTVVYDEDDDVAAFGMEEEGTSYPAKDTAGKYSLYTDYFQATVLDMVAIYSASTSDSVTLSLIGSNYEQDVAVCKIAADPTTKLEARPLRAKKDVSVGDTVFAIGYPDTADYSNTEARYDSSDSVVTKGVVSKIQLTSGNRNARQQFYAYMVDANITNGNSGGPLFTENGDIIGVNSFVFRDSEKVATANYSIAIDSLTKLLDENEIDYEMSNGSSIKPVIIAVVCLVVVLAAVGVVVFLLLLGKKKKAAQPAGAQQMRPGMVPPIRPQPYGNGVNRTVNNNEIGKTEMIRPVGGEGKKYIVAVSGPLEGRKFAVENDAAIIGRDPSKCNIVFPADQPGVSGRHCEVKRTGDLLTVRDLGSSYGTFLADGSRVATDMPQLLQDGERFIVGDKDVVFEVRYS